jgi:hypothetical protein
MSDDKIVPFNSSAELIEEAKKERQRLLQQIEQSQRTIEHSRQIMMMRLSAVFLKLFPAGMRAPPAMRDGHLRP